MQATVGGGQFMYMMGESSSAIGLHHYLMLGAVLLVSGVLTILLKRNAIGILMGVELVLNAGNINLVAFNRFNAAAQRAGAMDGQIFAILVIVIAAAEAAVALAIFLNFYNNFSSIDVEQGQNLKG